MKLKKTIDSLFKKTAQVIHLHGLVAFLKARKIPSFYLVIFGAFMIILLTTFINGVASNNEHKETIVQKEILTNSPTPSPEATTSYPAPSPTLTLVPSVTPTAKPTSTTSNTTTTNPSVQVMSTPTSTPTPTPTPSTGSISGVYVNAVTNEQLTDSRLAAAVWGDNGTGNSQAKPSWTIANLQPGRYNVGIDLDPAKYDPLQPTCNCTIVSYQYATAVIDVKAGDNLQMVWKLQPK